MRRSALKRGGGFLNDVDVTLVGYTFLVGEPATIKKGARKGETFTPLSLVPEFLEDGADEPKTQRLLIGDADNFGDVSADGRSLDMGSTTGIPASSEAGIFFETLIESGFPEENFDEDDTVFNLEPAIGSRLHLRQEVNAEKTLRQGKQKGKDGKEYDRRDLKVTSVLSVGDGTVPGAKASKGKAAPAAKAGKAAKAVDVSELATETLKGIIEAAGGTIKVAGLKMATFAALGTKHPQRDAVIAWFTPDNLADVDDVVYDAKKGTVSLAA